MIRVRSFYNNDYRNYFPAGHDLPNMVAVAVAASDRSDKLPTFSNYGRKTVDLAAPGDQIISTVKDSSLGVYSGTSMAAPHAAGAAALILHQFPQASPLEVKERLIYNSDPVPALSAASRSGGRINAHLSLEDDQVAPEAGKGFRITRADSQGLPGTRDRRQTRESETARPGETGSHRSGYELSPSPRALQ